MPTLQELSRVCVWSDRWAAGAICSPRSNIAALGDGRLVCGAVRDVVSWDARTGEVSSYGAPEPRGGAAESATDGPRGEVVAVAVGVDGAVAAAYASGLVRCWPRGAKDVEDSSDFDGHRAPVGALRWCPARIDGARKRYFCSGASTRGESLERAMLFARLSQAAATLCSGGANGDVVLWDVVAERGAARLRGATAASLSDLKGVSPRGARERGAFWSAL